MPFLLQEMLLFVYISLFCYVRLLFRVIILPFYQICIRVSVVSHANMKCILISKLALFKNAVLLSLAAVANPGFHKICLGGGGGGGDKLKVKGALINIVTNV